MEQGSEVVAEGTFNTEGAEQAAAAQEAPKVEEQKQEEAPKNDPLASKFAVLSKREKALRDKEAKLQQAMAELEERYNALQQQQQSQSSLEEQLKNKPLEVLGKYGITPDTLAQIALNEGNPTPEMQIKRLEEKLETKYAKELEALKEEIASKEKRQAEEAAAAAEKQFKEEIAEFVNGSDTYELIKANDAVDLIYDVIAEHYNETREAGEPKILSVEEAAQHVEKFLEEEVERLIKLKKVQAKLTPKEAAKEAMIEKKEGSQTTLSNTLSAQVPIQQRKLSDEESLAAAAKMLRWHE